MIQKKNDETRNLEITTQEKSDYISKFSAELLPIESELKKILNEKYDIEIKSLAWKQS